ncbi:hypothetical protein BMETH_356_1 [methanotrophic bacterial endosymbiont of Bathymodiolus sp.]|nr:hypothetical protein BMETH_356_1 [methanotrophic bacterial endosymbiont of Bathymodiolus sp.]
MTRLHCSRKSSTEGRLAQGCSSAWGGCSTPDSFCSLANSSRRRCSAWKAASFAICA